MLNPDEDFTQMDICTENDKNVLGRKVVIGDIDVPVQNQVGNEVEEDCTCNSKYMIKAMKDVGESIGKEYYWMPQSEVCYLVMDNAGGHGSAEAINDYTAMLKNNYNIEIIFQIPRSPITNVLDLGVWMSIQSIVERKHFLRCATTKALVNTVNESWESSNLNIILSNVFQRLKVVLCNILKMMEEMS